MLASESSQHMLPLVLMEDLKISQNVAEVYEKQWDVGFVEDVSAENQDVKVKFMGPPYPSVFQVN